jgi:hypothetical protein
MGPHITVNDETTAKIDAEAAAFMVRIRDLIGAQGPSAPLVADRFAASVGVQAVVRGLLNSESGEQNQYVLIGAADGVGMILGLIPDGLARETMFQSCVSALHEVMRAQARIHVVEGSA